MGKPVIKKASTKDLEIEKKLQEQQKELKTDGRRT